MAGDAERQHDRQREHELEDLDPLHHTTITKASQPEKTIRQQACRVSGPTALCGRRTVFRSVAKMRRHPSTRGKYRCNTDAWAAAACRSASSHSAPGSPTTTRSTKRPRAR